MTTTQIYIYGHQPDYITLLAFLYTHNIYIYGQTLLTRKWFPFQGELAPLMLYFLNSGHVCCLLDNLEKMKEAKKRRLEATFTATSTATFTAQARKSSDS